MKEVWLVTHDQMIDHRILTFSKYFEELNFKTRIFAAKTYSFQEHIDSENIYRPYHQTKKENLDIPQWQEIDLLKVDAKIRHIAEMIFSKRFLTAQVGLEELRKKYRDLKITKQHSRSEFIIYEPGTRFSYRVNRANKKIEYIRLNRNSMRLELEEIKARIKALKLENRVTNIDLFNLQKTGYVTNPELHLIFTEKQIVVYSKDYKSWCKLDIATNIISYFDACDITAELPPLENSDGYRLNNFIKKIYDFRYILEKIYSFIDSEHFTPPELIYVADLPTLPIGIILKEKFKSRLIVDCHEWWFEQEKLWNKDDALCAKIADSYERELYPKCDIRLTVGSELAKAFCNHLNIPFHVMYTNAAGINHLHQSTSDFWQKELNLPINTRVALFQGSLTTLRNLDNMIKAIDYMDDNHYIVIVGMGSYYATLKETLKEITCRDRIIFAGLVPQSALLSYTVNADIGLLPYYAINDYFSLCMPNKFSEYVESKLPMVIDRSMRELSCLVNKYQIGLCVNYNDPVETGQNISSTLRDPAVLEKYKQAYNTQQITEFDNQIQFNKLREILQVTQGA